MVVGADTISIWAKTKDGATEEVTDRFLPQPDENGVMQPPADIIRRRPSDHDNDESFTVRGVKLNKNPDRQEELKILLESKMGGRKNISLDEITQTNADSLGSYWDVRPPIPFVELSRMTGPVTEPPAQPPQLT